MSIVKTFQKKIFYLYIIVLALTLYSCTSNRMYNLESEINNFISKQNSNFELKLDTISKFDWDELLIAGPYTDLNRIDGYQLNNFSNDIKHHDKFTLFGFIKEKKGVKWIELKGAKIFDKLVKGGKNGHKIYPKKESIFKLKVK